MQETNLFWFGVFLEVGFVLLILWLVRPRSGVGDQLREKLNQVKKDYQRLQQDFQESKTHLSQECSRLRLELQKQNDQLMQEYLQQQQRWRKQEEELVQRRDRLIQERDRLQQEMEQQKALLTKEYILLQQEMEQQKVQFIQEYAHLQEKLQHQETKHVEDWRYAVFKQLQTLLVGYPSASKIALAKPDLPAKNLVAMFTPLDNLLQDWGYEMIGPVWEEVAYDPQLHQPDSPTIQLGEPVYIRFVGYRQGENILCPAKVSRTLPGVKKDSQ